MPTRGLATGIRLSVLSAVALMIWPSSAGAQSRGVYPLGMSAVNSGVTPEPGFTYSNQLLYYGRDQAKDDEGNLLPVAGSNAVVMDMNTLTWVSRKTILGGARYSAAATLPVASNNLTSDVHGTISAGGGPADSYYMPIILGWPGERATFRVLYGFLAPTGQFNAQANDNVGSGYWTSTGSAGQTFYLANDKLLALSAYEMYEFHFPQEGTETHPGGTFDLDYSVMRTVPFTPSSWRLQVGIAGYEQRQTTAITGPAVTPQQSSERYHVNAIGFALNATVPERKMSLGLRYFEEFRNRSTFQGFSLQISGAIGF